MPPSGLISGAVVSNLGHEQFRKVLNRLLTVEASIYKVPLTDLDLSCRDTDPDAGIDAKVTWPAKSDHDVLRPGDTVLQYKSGKITPPNIGTEFCKPGVQKALKHGARYVLLVGHDYVKTDADLRRKKLKELCRKRRISVKRCEILFGSQIARWISRHASIFSMAELGGYPAFSTVDGWLQHPQLQNPWKADEERSKAIEQIQIFARRETKSFVLRIEGPAGVGKTRAALEALRLHGIAETAIYTPNADEAIVSQFLTMIQGNPDAEGFIVIDECDRERQEELRHYADLAAGRLRLLCVGVWDALSPALASPNVLVLPPLGDSKMREILSAAVGTITQEVSDIAVRLAGGYVKLALFITSYVSQQKDIPPTDLAKVYDIHTFLKRFVDRETREALQLLSLLARVGWDAELKDEAEALARFCHIPTADFRRGAKTLRDRGVAVPRGRYLYVSPDLLAISAAADLWDEIGPSLINIVSVLPREGPRRELLKRLASMGSQPTVKNAVEDLLGEEGLFSTLPELDDEFRSEAFHILASALPDAAVTVLERVIERAPQDQLRDFRKGRRNIVWAIESLLRWPSTSLTAARSLMALALTENETWGNNATGIFCEYFQIYLSRSPIPFTERLVLIDELLEKNEPAARILAAKALGAAFSNHETRSGGNTDVFSGKQYPAEWRPHTWNDLWRSREAAVERLNLIAKGADEAAMNALQCLIDATVLLAGQGMANQAIEILERAEPKTDKDKRRLLDVARRLERDLRDRFSPDQVEQLHRIAANCFDSNYFGRLRRWAGRSLYTDYDLSDPNAGDRETSRQIEALAAEGYSNGISDEEIAWLASPEAENVWVFGLTLGQIDENLIYLDRIVSASPKNVNALLLASYIVGRANVKGEPARDIILDQLATNHPLLAFASTWRGRGSQAGLNRILSLVATQRIQPESLGYLAYGGWSGALSTSEVIRLVDAMLNAGTPALHDSVASILMYLLSQRPESIDAAEGSIWRLIAIKPAYNWQWQWGQLASKMIYRDAGRVVRTILKFFESDDFVPINSDETMKALQIATQHDSKSAWEAVGDAIWREDQAAMRLLIALKGWYGELVPPDTLIDWAKRNAPRGPWIVSRIIAVRESPLPERARLLIRNFPKDTRIRHQFAATLQTGMSMGLYSDRINADLSIAEGWARDSDTTIRSWARGVARYLKDRLKRQRIFEEEEQLQTSTGRIA